MVAKRIWKSNVVRYYGKICLDAFLAEDVLCSYDKIELVNSDNIIYRHCYNKIASIYSITKDHHYFFLLSYNRFIEPMK